MKSRNATRPAALVVTGPDLAGGHLQGGEQRRRAVALVGVAVVGQRGARPPATSGPGHARGPGCGVSRPARERWCPAAGPGRARRCPPPRRRSRGPGCRTTTAS